ncbi:peptide-methionine (S)-S-oxide reductase MsrA [Candidatus Woesebacteria bacterium]|nr:peptide-methionine (S)-S-oxide reductase MsrA [Candidatus Woesebacteria bacterium]
MFVKDQTDPFAQAKILLSEINGNSELKVATLAGGCFWCLQAPFEQKPGVVATIAGYAGGRRPNPSYEQVNTGVTGHREAVQVFFKPDFISYREILDIFWLQIDPTDSGGQFADRGEQYTTAIFYHSPEQHADAEASKRKLEDENQSAKPFVTKVLPFTNFYPAEDYHQQFYKKQPDVYYRYKLLSGRGK